MKKVIKQFSFFLFMYFFVVNSFGQETKKFYERLEIGTDISSIFEEDFTGFPGTIQFRLYHKYKPIAFRFIIGNNSAAKYKKENDDLLSSQNNRYTLSLSTGVDWFFLNKELYSMYFGNKIGGNISNLKIPNLDNDGNIVGGEESFTKSYSISNIFNLGATIKVYKKLSLCAESSLSFGTNRYWTGKKINGNTSSQTKDNAYFIEFDSFSSFSLLYHF